MTESRRCKIAGPYLPVGDTEFTCRTHGVDAMLRPGADPARKGSWFCPVGLIAGAFDVPAAMLSPIATKGNDMSKKNKNWAEAIEAGVVIDLTAVPLKALERVLRRTGRRTSEGILCLCDEHPCIHTEIESELERRDADKAGKHRGYTREAELDRDLTQVREELDRARRELAECRGKVNPPEPPEGSVVRFPVQYNEPGRTYSYVAYRTGGMWFVTGSINGFTRGTWSMLCDTVRGADTGIDAYRNGELRFEVAGPWEELR